jgi:hypothetical protein
MGFYDVTNDIPIEFLNDNNIKHVIKGNGNNLNELFEINKNTSKKIKNRFLN